MRFARNARKTETLAESCGIIDFFCAIRPLTDRVATSIMEVLCVSEFDYV